MEKITDRNLTQDQFNKILPFANVLRIFAEGRRKPWISPIDFQTCQNVYMEVVPEFKPCRGCTQVRNRMMLNLGLLFVKFEESMSAKNKDVFDPAEIQMTQEQIDEIKDIEENGVKPKRGRKKKE